MKTIFFVQGMGTPPAMWERFIRFFRRRGFVCYAPTLPLHHSPFLSPEQRDQLGRTGLADYADFLEKELNAVIRKHGEQPAIIGWSMGGLLAQMLAERGYGSQLILISPASPAGISSLYLSTLRSFRSAILRWGFWRKAGRQTFAEWKYSLTSLRSTINEEALRQEYEKISWESGKAATEIGFDFWPFPWRNHSRVDFQKIADRNCPILIIAGTEDRLTPISSIRMLARAYQNARVPVELVEWEGQGHLLYGEPDWEKMMGGACIAFLAPPSV